MFKTLTNLPSFIEIRRVGAPSCESCYKFPSSLKCFFSNARIRVIAKRVICMRIRHLSARMLLSHIFIHFSYS
jgi:hypothetical protein